MSQFTLSVAGTGSQPRRRLALLIAALLFAALLGLEMTLFPIVPRPSVSSAPSAGAGIDPRLVLHARSAPIGGAFAGGMRVVGTLYPALPGANTVRVVLRGPTAARVPGSQIELIATMPGMDMAPARATLLPRDGGYSGILTLPMFGRYHTTIALATPLGRITGTLTLALPLSQS